MMKPFSPSFYRAVCNALLGGMILLAVPSRAITPGKDRTVTTIAGYGINDRSVDVNLVSPGLLASDESGYIYFSDSGNNVVYDRDPWDIPDLLAGTGLPGFSGDGGPASQARLNNPRGVATTQANLLTDRDSALFVADAGNHRIRKIYKDPNGVFLITTIAGDGTATYKGDGGPALQAGLAFPEGIAVDANGGVYVADRDDHRVRKITPDGVITTYAGTGQPGFSGDGGPATQAQLNTPVGLLVDPDGNLFISDQLNNRIRKVSPNGVISTYIGGGQRTEDGGTGPETAISLPSGIALSRPSSETYAEVKDQFFFFTDGLRVRALVGGKIKTVAGNGMWGWTGDDEAALQASFRHPMGLAVPLQESLVISDDEERRVRRIYGLDSDSYINTGLGGELWDDTVATGSKLTLPVALVVNAEGRALIADYGNRRVRSIESPHNLKKPREPYYLYIVAGQGAASPRDGITVLDTDLNPPTGVAGDPAGIYYFSEGAKGRVWQVDTNGVMHQVPIPGLVYPAGLAESQGRLLVADRDAAKVWEVKPDGSVSLFAGTDPGDDGENGPAAQAKLNAPQAVALAPNGAVYITDTGNHKVKRVDPDGTIHTVAGTGQPGYVESGPAATSPLSSPRGVAVDNDGTLYIADTMNHRIARIKDGQLQRVSGGPEPGHPQKDDLTGDDKADEAGTAQFYEPAGLAFDGNGNLYIADERNHRIRAIWNAAAVGGPTPPTLPGDVNQDGRINVQDAILTLRIAIKLVTPTPEQKLAADVAPHPGTGDRPYGDGKVDATDAIQMIRRSLGIIKDGDWP
jgi:sugar lactone lactonase YvrE